MIIHIPETILRDQIIRLLVFIFLCAISNKVKIMIETISAEQWQQWSGGSSRAIAASEQWHGR